MVRKSDNKKAERKKITTDYLIEPGYPIIYARTRWMNKVEQLKKSTKNRRKRSKIDKWRFK